MVDPSEPSPWDADVVLADGGTVHVRPIRPDDADAFRAFHGTLSPQSVYYRFFSPKPRLSNAEVERFTTVDMVDRAALVAVLGDDIVADARYDRWVGKDEAEVAFAVADEHHGRGLSTLLLEHLAAIARLNGIARFTAEVLAENRPMLSVFARAGWPLRASSTAGSSTWCSPSCRRPTTWTPSITGSSEPRAARSPACSGPARSPSSARPTNRPPWDGR